MPRRSIWAGLFSAAGWSLVVVYFAAAATLLALRYWGLPNAARFSGEIEQAVSRTIGEHVTIGAIRAGWQGLHPEFELADVRIHDRRGHVALSLPAVEAVVSWTSLLHGGLRFRSLAFERPDLEIRRDAAGRILIAGMELKDDEAGPDLSDWLLSQQEIVVRDAKLSWDDELRAAPTLSLANVSFALRNSGRLHRFALRAQAPREYASTLDVRGELLGDSFAQLQDWTGRLFADIEDLDLAAWQRWIDYPIEVGAGRGGLRMWLAFSGKHLNDATADVALSRVAVRLGRELPKLELDHLRGRLGAREARGGIEVFGSGITLKSAAAELRPADFSVRWQPANDGEPQRGEVQANALDLRALAALAEYLPLPGEVRRRLAEIEPRGSVFDLSLAWAGDADSPQRYGLRGRFAGLGARAWQRVPGFSGLSGTIDGDEKGGSVQLNSAKLSIDIPEIFAGRRLQLDSLSGQLGWRRAPGALELKLGNLAFANAELAGTLFGVFTGREGTPGMIDLTGNFPRVDARAALSYIPWLPDRVGEYLKSAIGAGTAREVRLRLKGDLARFPFDDPKQGSFQVTAHVSDADFTYASGWPKLSALGADLLFEGRRMQIVAQRASVLGARVLSARAQVADLFARDPMLNIDGQADGPAAEFLRFIDESPVSRYIDNATADMGATGNARLSLKLALPLRRLTETRVAGTVQFSGNQLVVDPDVPPLTGVNGRLEFTESGLSARNISAQFLGGPATISASTSADGGVAISAQGTASVAGLRRSTELPLIEHASGSTAWRGSLSLRKRGFDLLVESSLAGVAINLPAPLGKSTSETLALRIERTGSADSAALKRLQIARLPPRGDAIAISLGPAVSVLMVRAREGGRLMLERGAVALGERAQLPDRPGLALSGTLAHLDVDQWRSLAPSGAGGIPLSSIALRLGAMDFGGRRLNAVTLRAVNAGGNWAATVGARELAGEITWRPEGRGRIVARLRHFTVPDPAPNVTGQEPPARELPALDIVADSFVARDHRFGRLELVAQNQVRDWRIERLVLSNPESTLTAEGVWQSWAARPSISVNVKLEVSDAGRYLERIGFPGTMRGGSARLEGKLGWAGNPQSVDYPTLTGQLALSAEKGQFLKAEPGIAKLLGVLSLQSLLTLDLRDLFREGFTFDSIASTAQVSKGVLTTRDFQMRGPSAQVSMSGEIDLAQETQRLRMRVVPSVGDSASTVAAFLLAHPIAALGAMIAQRVLKDPLGQIFAFEYDVTGTWADPKVERVKEANAAGVGRP